VSHLSEWCGLEQRCHACLRAPGGGGGCVHGAAPSPTIVALLMCPALSTTKQASSSSVKGPGDLGAASASDERRRPAPRAAPARKTTLRPAPPVAAARAHGGHGAPARTTTTGGHEVPARTIKEASCRVGSSPVTYLPPPAAERGARKALSKRSNKHLGVASALPCGIGRLLGRGLCLSSPSPPEVYHHQYPP
jgi:hypothetical protein